MPRYIRSFTLESDISREIDQVPPGQRSAFVNDLLRDGLKSLRIDNLETMKTVLVAEFLAILTVLASLAA